MPRPAIDLPRKFKGMYNNASPKPAERSLLGKPWASSRRATGDRGEESPGSTGHGGG